MRYQINQNQCGFLLKNGCFIKTLFCGTYHFLKMAGCEVVTEDMEGLVGFNRIPKEILMNQDQAFAEKVLHVIIPEGYIGILKKDGAVQKVLTETEYYYWNVWNRLEVELLDMREPETAAGVSKAYLPRSRLSTTRKWRSSPERWGFYTTTTRW